MLVLVLYGCGCGWIEIFGVPFMVRNIYVVYIESEKAKDFAKIETLILSPYVSSASFLLSQSHFPTSHCYWRQYSRSPCTHITSYNIRHSHMVSGNGRTGAWSTMRYATINQKTRYYGYYANRITWAFVYSVFCIEFNLFWMGKWVFVSCDIRCKTFHFLSGRSHGGARWYICCD